MRLPAGPIHIPVFHQKAKKLAVVFSVTKERKSYVVLKEALGLEKALAYAGYDLWIYGCRENRRAYPVTAKKEDFDSFAAYIKEKKDELKLQGVFIFITYHTSSVLDEINYDETFSTTNFQIFFT